MSHSQLDRAVARATGESRSTIRRMGFSLCESSASLDDPDERPTPLTVDWDQVDASRTGFLPQPRSLAVAVEAVPSNDRITSASAFYRAMSLFRQGKKVDASKVAVAAAAKMTPLPADEQNPLANNLWHDDLILWLAYKEAKSLIQFDSSPAPATRQ